RRRSSGWPGGAAPGAPPGGGEFRWGRPYPGSPGAASGSPAWSRPPRPSAGPPGGAPGGFGPAAPPCRGSRGGATPPRAEPAARAGGRAAQAALPAGTLPLERLQVIVPAMAATDPLRLQLDPAAVVAAGRNIIAGMVDCLPAPLAPSLPGGPIPPDPPWER